MPVAYHVYRSDVSGDKGTTVTTVVGDTSCTDTVSLFEQTYYYIVQTEDAYENKEGNMIEKSASAADQVVPVFDGVSTATATIDGSGVVTLEWDAAVDNSPPLTYNIYYATTPGGENFTSPVLSISNTTCEVNGLELDISHYFVVRSEDKYGNEDINEEEKITTPTDTCYASN